VIENFKFEDWQLQNVQKVGIDLPLNKRMWMSVDQIRDTFDVIAAEDVNPLGVNAEGSLGYQFYEWLAEAPPSLRNWRNVDVVPAEDWLVAARMFSWNYPQLKMIFHNVNETKSDEESKYYTDGVEFQVEFYE
jgi:hypothetical protein